MQLNGTMKPYLAFSTAGHAVLLVVLAVLMKNGVSQGPKVYRIDFIGASPGILNRTPTPEPAGKAKAARKARRPPPQTDPDAFNLRKPALPLPKPSFLDADVEAAPEKKAEEKKSAAVPAAGGDSSGGGGGPSASVSPDMPDFPYPWFISRVRQSLWDKWSANMPPGEGECTVVFSILRDGRVVGVRVELTSGDRAFDYVAVTAVQDAAPFPALPNGFQDRFLRVHVEFKSR